MGDGTTDVPGGVPGIGENTAPSPPSEMSDGGYSQNAIVFPTEFDGMTDLNNGILFMIYSEESASIGANSRTITQTLPQQASV